LMRHPWIMIPPHNLPSGRAPRLLIGFMAAHLEVEIKCEKKNDDKLILRRSEDQAVGVTFRPPDENSDMYIWYTAYQIVGKEGSA